MAKSRVSVGCVPFVQLKGDAGARVPQPGDIRFPWAADAADGYEDPVVAPIRLEDTATGECCDLSSKSTAGFK